MQDREQEGNARLQGEVLTLDGVRYWPERRIGEGKSAVSWLYRSPGGEPVTLKRFQTKDYNQIPHARALDFELVSHGRMAQSGIAVPRLRGYDRSLYYLVKDYIEGEVQIDAVAEDRVDHSTFQQLFALAGQLRRAGWHVDFYPANFVLNGGRLWCIDYEAHPYNTEWDLVNWGIWYWVNPEGIQTTVANPEAEVLNYPGTFKPRREGLEAKRDHLVRLFGHLA